MELDTDTTSPTEPNDPNFRDEVVTEVRGILQDTAKLVPNWFMVAEEIDTKANELEEVATWFNKPNNVLLENAKGMSILANELSVHTQDIEEYLSECAPRLDDLTLRELRATLMILHKKLTGIDSPTRRIASPRAKKMTVKQVDLLHRVEGVWSILNAELASGSNEDDMAKSDEIEQLQAQLDELHEKAAEVRRAYDKATEAKLDKERELNRYRAMALHAKQAAKDCEKLVEGAAKEHERLAAASIELFKPVHACNKRMEELQDRITQLRNQN